MDKKLEEYRRNKRRQAIINNFKEKLFNMVSFQQIPSTKPDHVIIDGTDQEPDSLKEKRELLKSIKEPLSESDEMYSDTESTLSSLNETIDDTDTIQDPTQDSLCFRYFTYVVYFLFWVTCYAIAIQLKFGTVYFLFSALFGVYLNTRTGPKKRNEISAYSVFNKNCEAIDGTLKAEQFEREIRYGAVGMK